MSDDLITWLRTQLDDEEAHARKDIWCAERATNGGHWQARYGYNLPYSELWADGEIGRLTATRSALADGEEDQHAADAMLVVRMVRSAERRARQRLREVDAKRRILDLHEGDHECSTIRRGVDCEGVPYEEIDNCTWVLDGDCSTVRLLALPHAYRPGYREDWRP
jgi:hypothetical protein